MRPITTSGNFRTQTLTEVILEVGPDRILYSVDYPSRTCGWQRSGSTTLPSAMRTALRSVAQMHNSCSVCETSLCHQLSKKVGLAQMPCSGNLAQIIDRVTSSSLCNRFFMASSLRALALSPSPHRHAGSTLSLLRAR